MNFSLGFGIGPFRVSIPLNQRRRGPSLLDELAAAAETSNAYRDYLARQQRWLQRHGHGICATPHWTAEEAAACISCQIKARRAKLGPIKAIPVPTSGPRTFGRCTTKHRSQALADDCVSCQITIRRLTAELSAPVTIE